MRVTTVTVDGMVCEHCKRAVFTSLAGVAGIERAQVEMGRVTVEHDGTVVPSAVAKAIAEAIAVAGYTVTSSTDAEVRRSLPLVQP